MVDVQEIIDLETCRTKVQLVGLGQYDSRMTPRAIGYTVSDIIGEIDLLILWISDSSCAKRH